MLMMRNKKLTILAGIAVVLILLVVTERVARTQTGGGSSMVYDPQNLWYLFTDNTGSWHAPLAIHNSSAASNSVTEFSVNTDNQFQIQNFGGGRISSFLNLDSEGSLSLYGVGGGGIGSEGWTGDTCIPTTLQAPCGPNSMRIGASGIVTQYRGQSLSGNGLSAILFFADTPLTGSFGPYTIFTTNKTNYASAGMYRLSGYIVETTSAPGATMQFAIEYTDETGPQSQITGAPVSFAAVGAKIPFEFVFSAVANSPISFTNTTTNSPTYGFHLRLEAL
jgi:hypothetical protein